MSGSFPGALSHSGTAVLDYGSVPAAEAQVDVLAQAGILNTSRVRAWFSGNAMTSNGITEHLMAGALVRLTPGLPVADTGFTIYADNIGGLATGTFRVQWQWSP